MGSRSSLPLLPAALGDKPATSSGDGIASSSIIHHTSSVNSSGSSPVASTTRRADIPAVSSLKVNSATRCVQSSGSHSRTLPQRSSGGKDSKQMITQCNVTDIGGAATACKSSRTSSHNVGSSSSSSVRGCNGSSSYCLESFDCSVGSDSTQWSVYQYSSSSSGNRTQWRGQQSCNSQGVVRGLSSSSEYPQGCCSGCTGRMRGTAAGDAVNDNVALTCHVQSIEESSDETPLRRKAASSSIQRSKSSSSKSVPKQKNSHKEEQRRGSGGAAHSSKEKKSNGMSKTSAINSSNRRRVKSRRSNSNRQWNTTEGSSGASSHKEKGCSRCSTYAAATEGGLSWRTAGKQSVSMSSGSSSKRRSRTSAGESASSRISPGSTSGSSSSSNRRNCSSALPKGSACRWKSATTQGSRGTAGARSRCSSSRSTRDGLQGNCSSGSRSSGNRSSEPQWHSTMGGGAAAAAWAALKAERPGRPRKGEKAKKPQPQHRPRRSQRGASQQQWLQQQQEEEQQQRDMLLALVLEQQGLRLQQQMGHLHPQEDEQQQQSQEREAEQDLVSAAAFLAAAANAVSPDEASVAVSPACEMGITPCIDAALSAASPSVLSHYQPSAAVPLSAPLRRLFNVVCGCTAARRPPAAAAASPIPPRATGARQARWPVPGTVPAALGAAALPSSAAAAAALAAAAGLAAAAAAVDDASLSEDCELRAAAAAAARAAALPASAAAAAKRRRAASAAPPAALQTSQIGYSTQQQHQDRRPRVDNNHGSINRMQQQQHERTTAAEEVPQEAQLQQLEQKQQRAKWQQTAVRLLKSITVPPAAAADRESSLFVFDLDDTLIPTEWIRSAYERRKQPTDGDDALYVYRDVSRDLNRMTDFLLMPLILRTLLKAKAWSSTVAIVTNARSSKWLSIIDSMFPELMMLLRSENIPVIRSSPAGEEPNALCIAAYFSYWMNAKKSKFEELLFYHFQKYPSAMTKRLDIISVGDNDFEEYAATFLALEVPTFVRFAKVVRCQTGLDPVDFIGQLQEIGEAIDRVCVEQTTQPAAFVGNSVMYRIQGWDQP